MERILEEAQKVCEEAEVFSVSQKETSALFESNRLKLVQTRQSKSIALRIIKEGRVGFAATSKPNSGKELLAMALEMAPFGAPAKFELPYVERYPSVPVYDPQVETVPLEDMVGLGESLIATVRAYEPDIVCEASVTRGITFIELLNSHGGRASYQKSIFGADLEGILIRGTDMLFVGESDISCHPLSDLTWISGATITQLEQAKRLASAPQGCFPVIFTPRGVQSALVLPLALAFNGKTVFQGASPLGKRQGERVFDERLSLWDDPTIEYRPASRCCDDEGVPTQRTSLVEKGVVTNFLYDLQTAGLAGVQSTGNATRPGGNLPTPSMSALVFAEGATPLEKMVADMKEGLIIEQLMGAGQGNSLGGDFSGNVLLGYKVERGEIVGRVKDTMVSGNIYEVLRDLLAIGDKARWISGSLRTPPLYCCNLAISVGK